MEHQPPLKRLKRGSSARKLETGISAPSKKIAVQEDRQPASPAHLLAAIVDGPSKDDGNNGHELKIADSGQDQTPQRSDLRGGKEAELNQISDQQSRSHLFCGGHGSYTQRELFFQQQEASEAFTFEYIENDGLPQHNMWLMALKNIFSKQLPNMPKEYITRLVFDRRHRSVAVVKKGGQVVGGITYRPFHAQAFGEIAFCAVSANDQVKGFGSRLMSFTKQFAKERDNLGFFLTYADNNAVTFFAKQGFTTEVTSRREQWFGYIKDYDGGTLMESLLHPELDYTRMPQMILAQKAELDRRISELSNANIVYPGLLQLKHEQSEPLLIERIPGVKEAGWTTEMDGRPNVRLLIDGEEHEPSTESICKFGHRCLTALRSHDDAHPFLLPVKSEEVPDYYDVIQDPIDISKVDERLRTKRYYTTLEIFQADVRRIFKNAQIYNAPETYWYKAAGRLRTFFELYLSANILAL